MKDKKKKKVKSISNVDQQKILKILITGFGVVSKEIFEIIKPKYFDNKIHQDILKIQKKFFEDRNKIPTEEELIEEVFQNWEQEDEKRRIDKNELETQLFEVLDKRVTKEELSHLQSMLNDFCRTQAVKEALIESTDELIEGGVEGIQERINKAFQIGTNIDLEIKSVAQLLKEEREDRDIFIEGWVERESLTILAGKQKIGKSILAINLMLALTTGEEEFLKAKIHQPRKVLYVQQEIKNQSLKDRIDKMRTNFDDDKGLDIFQVITTTGKPIKVTIPEDRARLNKIIKKAKSDLIVFDPLATFHTKDENKSKDMNEVLDYFFKIMKEYKVGILLIHHHGKPSQAERTGAQMLRGSSVMGDRADVIINLTPLPEKYRDLVRYHPASYAKLNFELRSDEPIRDFYIERDPEILWYEKSDVLAEEIKIKLTPEEVRNVVLENGGTIGRKELLEKLLEKTSKTTIEKNIKEGLLLELFMKQKLETKGNPIIYKVAGGKNE